MWPAGVRVNYITLYTSLSWFRGPNCIFPGVRICQGLFAFNTITAICVIKWHLLHIFALQLFRTLCPLLQTQLSSFVVGNCNICVIGWCLNESLTLGSNIPTNDSQNSNYKLAPEGCEGSGVLRKDTKIRVSFHTWPQSQMTAHSCKIQCWRKGTQ